MQTKTKFVGFDTLKHVVSMTQILERYCLLDQLHRSGDNLSGACPLHNGHNKTQFRVSLSKNCFICFTCHATGSIIDFVARKESINVRDAGLLIQDWFAVQPPGKNNGGHQTVSHPDHESNGHPVSRERFAPDHNPPLRFTLRNLDTQHPYLAERGLSAETIRTFGLGYCPQGSLAGHIAIPLHSASGTLIGYAGRWIGKPSEQHPKYKLPRGFRKSLELFNLHRLPPAPPMIIVVEGFFSCMSVWQAGRHAVSVMGSLLSQRQEALLISAAGATGRIILCFDEDDAGRSGRQNAWRRLQQRVRTTVVTFPNEGTQPDMLPPEELQRLVRDQGGVS